jgi:hypothetical protein
VSASEKPKVTPWVEPELLNGWTTPEGFQPPRYRLAYDGEALDLSGIAEPGDAGLPIFRLPPDLSRFFGVEAPGWFGGSFAIDEEGYVYVKALPS